MKQECYLFGGLLMDYYYSIDAWPRRGQDGFITGEKALVGGCAINMAATIKNLGAEAHVISGIGTDATGRELSAYMEANGLSREYLEDVKGLSGKCLVFLEPDGERTFLTGEGAEGIFTEEMDKKIRKNVLPVAGVTGYFLLNDDAERIMDCLEYLHGNGTKILFDPSPLVSSISEELLKRVIAISTTMTPNTTELETIQKYISVTDYCAAGKTMVVKEGGQGGTVYTADETFAYEAERCRAVDTTGAGDSFAGALLYGMMTEMPVREAVSLATKCAGKTVTIEGPHGFWKLEEK